DTPNPGWSFTTRLRQLRALLTEGIRSGGIRSESPSTGMLARCVLDVLWIPENILRARGKRAALVHARDTVLRGVTDRSAESIFRARVAVQGEPRIDRRVLTAAGGGSIGTDIWSEHAGAALMSDEANSDGVGQLGLLASAISSRALQGAPGKPGAPAWTDGRVVFVDADSAAREQVEALAVQASLLAAGSLDPDVVRRLVRRPALARRYLAVEGHRALAAIEYLLPPSVRSLIDSDVAVRADSPAPSLAAALSRGAIADPPDSFGAIRARHLLASVDRADNSATTRPQVPGEQRNQLMAELAENEDDDDGTAADLFSSPVGGGGALGRLLGQLLEVVRQLRGGGPPGADAPTHRTRASTRGGNPAAVSTRVAGTAEEAAVEGRGT